MLGIFLPFLEYPLSGKASLLCFKVLFPLLTKPSSLCCFDLLSAFNFFKEKWMILGIFDFRKSLILKLFLFDNFFRCLFEEFNPIFHFLLCINKQSFHLSNTNITFINLWYSWTLFKSLDCLDEVCVCRVIGLNSISYDDYLFMEYSV